MTHLRKHRKSQLSSWMLNEEHKFPLKRFAREQTLDPARTSCVVAVCPPSGAFSARCEWAADCKRCSTSFRVSTISASSNPRSPPLSLLGCTVPWSSDLGCRLSLATVLNQVTNLGSSDSHTVYTLGCAWTTLSLHFEHVPSAVRPLRKIPRSGRPGMLLNGHASHWVFRSRPSR